jgi:choline-sulfatase
MRSSHLSTAAVLVFLGLLAPAGLAAAGPPPNLVLLTLDTTRSDHLGSYGDAKARTPVLDALAARGTRYARALTAAPLTLPAHCSLLTGLEPPEHGVRDNGVSVLPSGLPTLATVLRARGYATGAFVSSRVLDRRFGLGRGFEVYDDRMAAERTGEYGYPERNAEAVTTAALAWASRLPPGRPFFLWIHYYDPHSPYSPPRELADLAGGDPYAGEIAYMDRQIGRLLSALPGDPARRLVAAVGDHGEALGEHGERAHGIFLYRASLEVPLLLAGPGVPTGRVVRETVAARRLAPALLRLLGAGADVRSWGRGLPGLPGEPEGRPEPVYSEARLPAGAYGWSSLTAISDGRWRLIVAPRPELYDFIADPAERRDLLTERRDVAARLKRTLAGLESAWKVREAPKPAADPGLGAALRSLGYLSGASGNGGGTIDPKDGIALLADFERAKELATAGRFQEAAARLSTLAARNPRNVPFLAELARAQLRSGQGEAALATYRRALEVNPALDFLHLQRADACRELGRTEEARREYELTLKLNPRMAPAWLGLARLAVGPEEALRVLRRAAEAGTDSGILWTELARLEIGAGDPAAADRHLAAATALLPGLAPAWVLWGERAEASGDLDGARQRYLRAVAADPADPASLLHLGRLLLRRGETADGRRYLERAATAGPRTPAGQEARRLLSGDG